MLSVVGLSHKNAPIEVRERIAISGDRLAEAIRLMLQRPEVGEVMILSTCNRVEVFGAPASAFDRDGSKLAQVLQDCLLDTVAPADRPLVARHLFQFVGDSAIRHLFRVASSLDSLVVGEPQILGQVKDAFESASSLGAVGRFLGRAVEGSLHVAKRVRSETQVGAGSVSVASVAVELASQIFGDLDERVVALLGAGEMAETAAKSLCSCGANLLVVNRNLARAEALASRFDGLARAWSELEQALIDSDVVISSTSSPTPVITHELMAKTSRRRKGRSLFLVDIAVPRDVDPKVNQLDGIYLYDIDDLSKIANQTMRDRLAEAQRAERIIDEEVRGFEAWVDSLEVTPTVVALRNHVRDLLQSELQRSLTGKLKHLSDADRKVLQDMANAAVNKLTHLPTTRLKQAASDGHARDLIEAVRLLFDLPECSTCEPPSPRPSSPTADSESCAAPSVKPELHEKPLLHPEDIP
jgi:glutamyl-tRNA reductase